MKPGDRMPPLNALRAFEVVARRLSFARAAEELHVTKAAVAQQVRLLEQEIGGPLVQRSGRGLALTELGAAGAAGLAEGFATLARAARAMREAKGRRFLVINASASFAATWLVGRIGKFKARHPEIDVLLDANPMEDALNRAQPTRSFVGERASSRASRRRSCSRRTCFRSAPRHRLGRKPAARARRSETPHAAASGVERGLSFVAVLVRLAQGCRRAGRRGPPRRLVQQYGDGDPRGCEGQGVALGSLAIVADELAAGRLIAPFSTSVRTPFGYYFLCRPGEAETPRIKAFREFLVEEAALSAGEPA